MDTDAGGSSTNESGHGNLPEPTASRRRVLQATAGGTLAAGAGIWSRGARAQDGTAEGTTVYIGGESVFNTDEDEAATDAVDADTGKGVWRFSKPVRNVQSSPAVVDRTVHVGALSLTTPPTEHVQREDESQRLGHGGRR